jgi:hypothetical protein
LEVTTNAVRSRLSRGTPRSVKEGGTVYVLLAADTRGGMPGDMPSDTPGGSPELVTSLQDQIAFLRSELQQERQAHCEARRLLAAALERMPPAIEAPEPRESRETATEMPMGPSEASEGPQEAPERRTWWREFFGFE